MIRSSAAAIRQSLTTTARVTPSRGLTVAVGDGGRRVESLTRKGCSDILIVLDYAEKKFRGAVLIFSSQPLGLVEEKIKEIR